MQFHVKTPEEYLITIPEKHRQAVSKLRRSISSNLPEGFEEVIQYGMIGFVVPHNRYKKGYHVNPELPLPFISIASQKNHIALYHAGIYASTELKNWFIENYKKQSNTILDMGNSCIRFKRPEQIPMGLIEELSKKLTPENWIALYESMIPKKQKK